MGGLVYDCDGGGEHAGAVVEFAGRFEGVAEVVHEALFGEGAVFDRDPDCVLYVHVPDSFLDLGELGRGRWVHESRVPAYAGRKGHAGYLCRYVLSDSVYYLFDLFSSIESSTSHHTRVEVVLSVTISMTFW